MVPGHLTKKSITAPLSALTRNPRTPQAAQAQAVAVLRNSGHGENRVENLGSDNSLKSPQISKVSVQTASNTPWMQGKAFFKEFYSIPVP